MTALGTQIMFNQDSSSPDQEYLQSMYIPKLLLAIILFPSISVYLGEGFLHLQNLVGMSIVEWLLNQQSPGYNFVEIPVNTKVSSY